MSSSETPELILHRWPGRWNLPSLSPECIAVETYLRLAGLRFAAEDCRTHYASPSGALPALDQNLDVVGGAVPGDTNRDPNGTLARHRIVEHLRRKVRDVDAHLGPDDRAQLAAYVSLVEHKLATATAWYQWIDKDRFAKHTRPAYGAAFPAPLSHVLPWMWRRTQLAGAVAVESNDDRVRDGLRDAYASLAAKLASTGGPYLLGAKPTSVDALLFAHLAYHARAPCMDVARGIMKDFPALVKYVEAVEQSTFPTPDGGNPGRGGSAPGALTRRREGTAERQREGASQLVGASRERVRGRREEKPRRKEGSGGGVDGRAHRRRRHRDVPVRRGRGDDRDGGDRTGR